jgi:hypothetical protein
MKAALSLCPVLLSVALVLPARTNACAPPPLDRDRLTALIEQLDDEDYDRRAEADRVLRGSTKLAVPFLQRELDRHSSLEVRKRLEGIIRELSADEHVPELVRLLAERQPDIHEQADFELRRFGKVIVPLLKNELKTAADDALRQRLERLIQDLNSSR